jgi:hypothetical protein
LQTQIFLSKATLTAFPLQRMLPHRGSTQYLFNDAQWICMVCQWCSIASKKTQFQKSNKKNSPKQKQLTLTLNSKNH